ncbi:helicase HerA-like domain-containing protein [Paralimibaculum aggregatum]|nr:helicase HerA-like domain-containing protein [Limibaculum sp. NKW23]
MDTSSGTIFVGGGGAAQDTPCVLRLDLGNRHGLITGATGTGKTVTLQILAEGFARAGTSVFLADVKGDLSGLAESGAPTDPLHPKLQERAATIGLDPYPYEKTAVEFWDVFGEQGHPVRTTVTEMGPLLLARLMDLNETQEGVLTIAFHLAEDEGLALLDLKDLRAMLTHLGENAREVGLRYGRVSTASIGAIQRRLLVLETEGAAGFFGEPALELADLLAPAPDGRGRVNILAADRLMHSPRLYAIFLLWLLSELWEELPEVGDPERPRFVFFFDEAHLLFDRAPRVLVQKVEQVARLIRSKGVGVYFVTQNPDDVPEDVLSQLGNRFSHALRAYTPRQRKALRAAAETFRPNPRFDTAEAIRDLGVGEALVSCLETKGVPAVVERVLIRPPSSRLGPCDPATRARIRAASPLARRYARSIDRESAYELLAERAAARAEREAREAEDALREKERARAGRGSGRSRRQSPLEAGVSSAMRSVGRQLGNRLVRSLIRGLFR